MHASCFSWIFCAPVTADSSISPVDILQT